MLHFLAVDIGGSKTKLAVFDEKLNIFNSAELPGYGISHESDESIPDFEKAVIDVTSGYNIKVAAVNLGGKNKNQIHNAVKKCLPKSDILVFRESEGLASILLGKHFDAECVLLAGTGTIVCAFDNSGKNVISGGWGMNIGDFGSGYFIGLEAIQRSLEALDGKMPLTPLQSEITGLKEPISPAENIIDICNIRDEVRSRIFPLERRNIAALTLTVARHCENNQADALEIMSGAGRHMASLCISAVNKLLPYKVKKIVVTGGLLKCKQYFQSEFERAVRKSTSVTSFEYVNDGVMLGTELAALEIYNKEN